MTMRREDALLILTAFGDWAERAHITIDDREVDMATLIAEYIEEQYAELAQWSQWVAIYKEWHKAHTGRAARIQGQDGAALKLIAKYLRQEAKQQDEAGALDAWRYILANWGRLSDFIQRQVALTQMNKNLPEILTTLRHGGANKQADKRATAENLAASIAARRRRHTDDEGGSKTG